MIFKLLLFISVPVLTLGQEPYKINEDGQLDNQTYERLLKEKGYDLISDFDTVSYNPLLIYAFTFKNKKFGLIDINGKEILSNDYDDIIGLGRTIGPTFEFHDYIFLEKDKNWALATIDGQLITKFEYEGFNHEKSTKVAELKTSPRWNIPVQRDSIFKVYYNCTKYGCDHFYMNTRGEKVNYHGFAEQEKERDAFVREHGYYPARGKSSEVNENNFNIPKELGEAARYTDQFFYISKERYGIKDVGIYDTLLKNLVIPIEYESIRLSRNKSIFYATKPDHIFIMDTVGNLIHDRPLKNALELLNSSYEIGDKKNEAVIVRNEHRKKAIFSKYFEPISDFVYDYISYSDNWIIATSGNEDVLLDYAGEEQKFKVEFDKILLKKNEYNDSQMTFLFLKKGKKLAIVSNEGKLLSDFEYESILPEFLVRFENRSLNEEPLMTANYLNNYIFFEKEGKYGVMNNDYSILLKNQYDMIVKSMTTGFLYLGKESKEDPNIMNWGVYDVMNKREIIPVIYQNRIERSSDFFIVRMNNKYGVFDKNGDEILPTEYDKEIDVNFIYKGMYSFETEYQIPFAYKGSNGKIIYIKK